MAAEPKSLLLALVQLKVRANKAETLASARALVTKAAENGARLISLPECFNCPYGTQYFANYAEEIPGETTDLLSTLARDLKIHLVGGSIPESYDGKLYNTATVFGPDGEMLGKFRKVHLVDIDVPGKVAIQESSVLSPGSDLFSFYVGPFKVGIGICYDLRFPEFSHLYYQQGCSLLLYPGAFSLITGPAHWQPLLTARALDHQVYVAGCGPARDMAASYVTWGHSMVVDPWGKVVAKTDEKEGIVYADIDLDHVEAIRQQIPLHFQKRNDMYKVENMLSN